MAPQDTLNTPAGTVGANDNSKAAENDKIVNSFEAAKPPSSQVKDAEEDGDDRVKDDDGHGAQVGHRCQTLACLLSCIRNYYREKAEASIDVTPPAIFDAVEDMSAEDIPRVLESYNDAVQTSLEVPSATETVTETAIEFPGDTRLGAADGWPTTYVMENGEIAWLYMEGGMWFEYTLEDAYYDNYGDGGEGDAYIDSLYPVKNGEKNDNEGGGEVGEEDSDEDGEDYVAHLKWCRHCAETIDE